MSKRIERLRNLATKSPTVKNISTLLSGTVLSQLLAIATTPIISRLYTPEQMGIYTLFTSVAAMFVAIAGLRYDLAIVLPKSHGNARLLRNTVTAIIAVFSIIITVLLIPFGELLANWLGNPALAPWLVFVGIAVFTLAQVNSFSYWFTRTLEYKAISINKVEMSGSIAVLQILFSLLHLGGVAGLIIGHIGGQTIATGTLMYKGRRLAAGEHKPTISRRKLLSRYKKMPLINGPNALVDAVRLNGIMMMVGAFYSASSVGQFGQAWRLMQAPVSLVTGAVSQVFYQKFATIKPGQMTGLVKISVKFSLLFGILPFFILLIISPWLFPWFLGAAWAESGIIAQALVPWLFLNVATSPISTMFLAADRQLDLFIFAVVYMLTGLGTVYIGSYLNWSPAETTWLLSLSMAICLIGMIALAFRAAHKFDYRAAQ